MAAAALHHYWGREVINYIRFIELPLFIVFRKRSLRIAPLSLCVNYPFARLRGNSYYSVAVRDDDDDLGATDKINL